MTYLEVKDDGPYQAQGQLGVSISDVIISDVDQFDLSQMGHKYVQLSYGPLDSFISKWLANEL